MKKSIKLFPIVLSIIASISFASCHKNAEPKSESSSQISEEESISSESPSEIILTESYQKARNDFYSLTNIYLLEVENLEVEPYTLGENDKDLYLSMVSTSKLDYEIYLRFEQQFRGLFGNPVVSNPSTNKNEDRSAEWITIDRWYQTMWETSNKHIHVNTRYVNNTKDMSQTYKKAREQFYSVTGISLPIIYDVNALETNINNYVKGQSEYRIDLISGDSLNDELFQTLFNFFSNLFGQCKSGYPIEDEEHYEIMWKYNKRDYQLIQYASKQISIYTKESAPEMSDSYKQGREIIYSLSNLLLPELYDVELLSSSYFDVTNKIVHLDFNGDIALFNSIVHYIESTIDIEPINEDDESALWIYTFELNNNHHQMNLNIHFDNAEESISIIVEIDDYYDINLISDGHGVVKMEYQSIEVTNNSISLIEGEKITLSAENNKDYEFDGWYINDQLLSMSNPYNYTVTKQDVTIEGRFKDITYNMTNSYKKSRDELYDLTGLLLPIYSGLEVSEYEYVEGLYYYEIFINSGDNLDGNTHNLFKEFFDEELKDWNVSDPKVLDNLTYYVYTSIYQETLFFQWDSSSNSIFISISFNIEFEVDDYEELKEILMIMHGVNLPSLNNISVNRGEFNKNTHEARLSFYSQDFTIDSVQPIFNSFVDALGTPSIAQDEAVYQTSWATYDYSYVLQYDLLGKIITIDILFLDV